jgi:integrase/recombinase XerD
MTSIAPHITAFLRERLPLQRGASPHTCESYAYTFQLLFEFASNQHKVTPSKLYLEQIDALLVMDFLAHIEATRDNGARTRNARLAAIKSFMRFVEHRVPSVLEQSLRILAIPSKKVDMPLIRYLSIAEMEAILNAPDLRTRSGIRDRAMLHLGFAAGLRVSELTGLLLTACGRPMTRVGFTYLLRKHVSTAARSCPSLLEKQVSPHLLRHSCAMMIFQATGDLRKVSLWLGHAHMQTTEIYLRSDPTEKIEAIEGVTPPALRRGRFTVPDKLIASLRGA